MGMATKDRWFGAQVQNLSDNNRQISNGGSLKKTTKTNGGEVSFSSITQSWNKWDSFCRGRLESCQVLNCWAIFCRREAIIVNLILKPGIWLCLHFCLLWRTEKRLIVFNRAVDIWCHNFFLGGIVSHGHVPSSPSSSLVTFGYLYERMTCNETANVGLLTIVSWRPFTNRHSSRPECTIGPFFGYFGISKHISSEGLIKDDWTINIEN